MNILIIGCNGFIGTHLARRLTERENIVSGCDLGTSSIIPISAYFQAQNTNIQEIAEMWAIDFDLCINCSSSGIDGLNFVPRFFQTTIATNHKKQK